MAEAAEAATRARNKLRPSDNARLLRPGWSENWYTASDIQLHVVEAGSRGDPLLILLHGFPEFWWAWRHQIEPLAAAGFHVVAPDMRGYNLSGRPTTILGYGLERLVADVLAIADHFGARQFSLAGHDWGGVIAWAAASTHPDRLSRLIVLNAPHPGSFGTYLLSHPAQVVRSSYAAFFQLPRLPELMLARSNFAALRTSVRRSSRPGTFGEAELDTYAEAWTRPGALTAMLNYYRALRSRRRTPVRVPCPALLLWGGRDQFLETGLAQLAVQSCDDGRLQLMPDATHWLHLEEPQAVAERMVGFLAA